MKTIETISLPLYIDGETIISCYHDDLFQDIYFDKETYSLYLFLTRQKVENDLYGSIEIKRRFVVTDRPLHVADDDLTITPRGSFFSSPGVFYHIYETTSVEDANPMLYFG